MYSTNIRRMDTMSSVSYFVRTVWLTSRSDNSLRSFSFFACLTHNFYRQLSDLFLVIASQTVRFVEKSVY